MNAQEILGEGILSWFKSETETERFGMIFLEDDQNQNPSDFKTVKLTNTLVGESGTLIAKVVDITEVLGVGRLFINSSLGFDMVGVVPTDNRPNNWLNPDILFKLRGQKTRLTFSLEN